MWLNIKNKVHIPENGSYVVYSNITDISAKINVHTEIKNTSNTNIDLTIVTKVFNAKNIEVASVTNKHSVGKNKLINISQDLLVPNPKLWSPVSPNLYTIETLIKKGTTILDKKNTVTGIRTLKFDAEKGFWLNGENIKIKGVCMHHEAGSIGSAVPEDVWRRRLQLLKDMGCNAIRTSHTPFRPEFYELCNSMGMMVMDESFDGWDKPKVKYDYGLYFNEFWEKDLTYFIKRDRNHPSVIMWSIGNEVRGRTDKVEHELVDLVHQLDSTRPVTIGAGHDAKICDIAGFNGQGERPGKLESVHKEHPNWAMIGTEVPHSWQTRGIYRTKTWWRGRDFPAPWNPKLKPNVNPPKNVFPIPDLTEEEVFTGINKNYLSSYDNATVRISARDQWKRTSKFDFFMGEFRWTGFDYLGENIWPNRGWHCGILDLAGFKKDHYYFYQSVWTKEPMVHVLPHWSHKGKEGVAIPVVVYTNCEEVELFLNGKSLGTKKDTKNDLRLVWNVPYKAGVLKAVARNKGKIAASKEHITATEPYAIKLITDRTTITADKRNVAHITVKIVDKHENFVPDANTSFTYEIKGSAKLLGIENGDMLDLSTNTAAEKKTFNGLSMIYLQSTLESSNIEVIVKSKGLQEDKIYIKTNKK